MKSDLFKIGIIIIVTALIAIGIWSGGGHLKQLRKQAKAIEQQADSLKQVIVSRDQEILELEASRIAQEARLKSLQRANRQRTEIEISAPDSVKFRRLQSKYGGPLGYRIK